MSEQEEEILLQLANVPNCGPCGGPGLLLANLPHLWKNSRDEDVHGIRAAILCPACDAGEPATNELLTLFAADEQLDLENIEEFGGLVAAWVKSVRQRKLDIELLNEEHERWRQGDL
ncbi:DUF6300 family protein [Streptomyces sp. NPDC000880]